jgi:radical SAM superfamily enzyme YgiQ (UPF0313 family)
MSFTITLIACYELGHQPLSLAWPIAKFKQAKLNAAGFDISVEEFPVEAIRKTDMVGISVPMHTALRLGVQAAKQIRALNPTAHIIFYGLYAWLNRAYLLAEYADSIIGGEYEDGLVQLAIALSTNIPVDQVEGITTLRSQTLPNLPRQSFLTPDRTTLPPLEDYAHYTHLGEHHINGYVEASRGCLHTCQHCPVVPIYNGRFFIVPFETVMADIRQQVLAGARHITFGDPDFLNGPGHALKIIRQFHKEFPQVTFSFTTKVEHILENQTYLAEFAEKGCTFIVSAFEATSDKILALLQKEHTLAQMEEALGLLGAVGIAPQSTWMPFTPWTSYQDYLDMLTWIQEQKLIQHVPAVQLAIRMLVPPESALINHPDIDTWLGEMDAENFTYRWAHADPRMDRLQLKIAKFAEEYVDTDPVWMFREIEKIAYEIGGREAPLWQYPTLGITSPPQLTEHWFC